MKAPPAIRKALRKVLNMQPALDLTGSTVDAVEGAYRSDGRPFLLDFPIVDCRVGFFPVDETNPFVRTLTAYGAGECSGYTGSPLERFYREWQPRTLAESNGLFEGDVCDILKNPAGSSDLTPWMHGYDAKYTEGRLERRDFRKVRNRTAFASGDITGALSFGPVSDAFGEITFARLARLYDSIRSRGYRPSGYGAHIRSSLYVSGRGCRAWVRSGKHRIYVLRALGHETIPIRFGGDKQPVMVRREDARSWPNVRAGFFTVDQALSIFDRTFDGRHPSLGAEIPAGSRRRVAPAG